MANSVNPDQTAPIYRSSLFWVHAVCIYTEFDSNFRHLFAADDFSRRHFQMHLFSWRFKGLVLENMKHLTISSSSPRFQE